MSEYEEYVCRHYPDSFGEKSITLFGVPIVRCRDCKWISKDTAHYKACYRLHAIEFMVEPDGFCSWGERVMDE